MIAHMYAKKYGIPLEKLKEQMALVPIKNHNNGKFNPKAHFPSSIRDIMNNQIAKAKAKGKPVPTWSDEMDFLKDTAANRYICDPLQLYDCCPFSDGGAASVVTSLETAKHLTDKPVIIAGVGQGSAGPLFTQKDITRIRAREISGKQAYDMSGLSPKDIDLCEIHDCFSIAEIVATEALGFFEFGKGAEALEKGETKIGGKIAINTSGGLKSKGHPIGATGSGQAYEVVRQLRGEVGGPRQVDGAKVGMTDTLGGDLGTICNIILKRGW
jgi:acetyl-CoA C-acetyltransferase/acetyl-CoA acyltransferase